MPIPLPSRFFLITIFRQMVTIYALKSRLVRFLTKIHLSINQYKSIIAENLILSENKNY